MKTDFKPTGYNSVSPYIIVKGAQRFMDLMNKLFDGKQLRRYDRSGGTIMHAEIQIDDSIVMLAEAPTSFPKFPWLCMYMFQGLRKPSIRL